MELNKILTNVLQNVYKSKDVSNIIDKFQIKYFYNTISITNSLEHFIEYYVAHIGLIKTIKFYKDITINHFYNGIRTKNYVYEKTKNTHYKCIINNINNINNEYKIIIHKYLYKIKKKYDYCINYNTQLYIVAYNINNLIYKIIIDYKSYYLNTQEQKKQMFNIFNFTYYNKYMYLF
jgi:hypothetical protein